MDLKNWECNFYWWLKYQISLNEKKYSKKDNADGKKRLLASGKFNLEKYVSLEPFYQTEVHNFSLKPESAKIKTVNISFQIASQFIKEGKAT